MRGSLLVLIAVLLASFGGGCDGCGGGDPGASDGPVSAAPPGLVAAASLVDLLPTCDVEHRGGILDFGSPAMVGRYRAALLPPAGVVDVEHDGASWARIYDSKVTLTFHLPHVSPIFISLRAIGRDARLVNVALDEHLLDVVKLQKDKTTTVTTRTTSLPVDAGLHRLELRFRGGRRSESEPYAEIDWIRIGVPDELGRTYGAPTVEDVLTLDAQLAGVPHRALSLNAPGSVRCTLRVPPRARLRAAVGMGGVGKGTAAIVLHRGGSEKVLEQLEVVSSEEASWTDLEIPLDDFAYEHVTFELRAVKTSGTGRLMFGDPTIFVRDTVKAQVPKARAVVVVALGGVTKADLPPWSEAEAVHLPTFRAMAQRWTVFDDHRAPSTLVSATMASLMTGLSPRSHALADPGARLPPSLRTLGAIARDASIRAGMFTSVPFSFGFFGFDAQWEKFEAYPPNGGRLASAPMEDATTFLSQQIGAERPIFALLHVRGGHPPWEVTPDEAAKLPPDEYAGMLSPRRAAQQLAELGGRHTRLSEGDEERLRALFLAGLARQDRALGKLIDALEESDLMDQTLFIVTGDVASARRSFFADGLELEEPLLSLPLFVHFPGGEHGGRRIERPTEIYDVTRTAIAALGATPAPDTLGHDLFALADGFEDVERLRVAVRDERYSARWGDFVLAAGKGEKPRLCELLVDPTCSYDRTALHPAVAQTLIRRLAQSLASAKAPPPREPLTLDSEAAAMLDVWGAY